MAPKMVDCLASKMAEWKALWMAVKMVDSKDSSMAVTMAV